RSGDKLTFSGTVSPRRAWTSVVNRRYPLFWISTRCGPSATCTRSRSSPSGPCHRSPSIVTSAPDGCTRIASVADAERPISPGPPGGGCCGYGGGCCGYGGCGYGCGG